MRTRQWRRRQRFKAVRWSEIVHITHWYYDIDDLYAWESARKLADNLACCTGHCHFNPRKHGWLTHKDKITRQERGSEWDEWEQTDGWYYGAIRPRQRAHPGWW